MDNKLKKKATEEFFQMNEGLSDADYSFNPETGKYDIPALEWDGPYGTHWVRYESEDARQAALDKYQSNLDAWVANRIKEIKAEKKAAYERFQNSRNTLDNMFPGLREQLDGLTIVS